MGNRDPIGSHGAVGVATITVAQSGLEYPNAR
jgi:hypothetical protein